MPGSRWPGLAGLRPAPDGQHQGHAPVLIHVAKQIRGATRTRDAVARLGGDEFVVICEGATPEEAAEIVQPIVKAVRQPAIAAGTMVTVTASVGLVAAELGINGSGLLR